MMNGEGHQPLICDLTNADAVKEMVASLPPLNGIVHCAGIGQRVPVKQLKEQDVDKVMNVNFKAPVLLQSALLQQKKVNKGASIVFIASIASWSPSLVMHVIARRKVPLSLIQIVYRLNWHHVKSGSTASVLQWYGRI